MGSRMHFFCLPPKVLAEIKKKSGTDWQDWSHLELILFIIYISATL